MASIYLGYAQERGARNVVTVLATAELAKEWIEEGAGRAVQEFEVVESLDDAKRARALSKLTAEERELLGLNGGGGGGKPEVKRSLPRPKTRT